MYVTGSHSSTFAGVSGFLTRIGIAQIFEVGSLWSDGDNMGQKLHEGPIRQVLQEC